MDDQQNSTPFPGVVLMKSNYLLQYSGSKQSLVAYGLLKDKHFPGEQGNKVTVNQIEGKEIAKTGFSPSEFRKIRIIRHDGASKLFHVTAYFFGADCSRE